MVAGPVGWLSPGLLISRNSRGTSRVGQDKINPPLHDNDSVTAPTSYCLGLSLLAN